MKVKLSYIIIGILSVLLHSCSEEALNFSDNTEKAGVVVAFSMNVKSPALTRGVASSTLETSSIKVLAYDLSGGFVGELPMLKCETTAEGTQFYCAFTGSIPANAGPANAPQYKFVVLANCTNRQYGMSYDAGGTPQIEKLDYTYPLTSTIPVWGIKKYTFQYQDNKLKEEQQLGTIDVLRAAAKVRVKLSPELKAEGFDIVDAKIKSVANRGYCVPANWNSIDETAIFHGNSSAFRPVEGSVISRDVNLTRKEVEDTISVTIYIPEISNGTGDNENAISLTLKNNNDGSTYEYDYSDGIKFRIYEDGKATDTQFDIVRNHFYDYTITDINIGLKLNLDVADWELADIWDLDFSAPIHTQLLLEPNTNADAPTMAPVVSYNNIDDEAGAFVGYFKMDSPAGVSWKPTLTNASAGDFEVRVYTHSNNLDSNEELLFDILVEEPEIPAAGNRYYKIVVVAKNPNIINKVVKLGISYVASWNEGENTLLVINKGGNNGLYYPWTDNDPLDYKDDPDENWISITQGRGY